MDRLTFAPDATSASTISKLPWCAAHCNAEPPALFCTSTKKLPGEGGLDKLLGRLLDAGSMGLDRRIERRAGKSLSLAATMTGGKYVRSGSVGFACVVAGNERKRRRRRRCM